MCRTVGGVPSRRILCGPSCARADARGLLPLIVCPRLDEIALQGGTLEIDLDRAVAASIGTGHSVPVEPISEYAMRILDFGGIKPLMLQAEANR